MVVFLRFIEGSFDILVNRLHKYCGAKLLRDLKTIVLDSLSISSPMVFQSGFFISVKPGVSKLLPVTIRAALVCIFATGYFQLHHSNPKQKSSSVNEARYVLLCFITLHSIALHYTA